MEKLSRRSAQGASDTKGPDDLRGLVIGAGKLILKVCFPTGSPKHGAAMRPIGDLSVLDALLFNFPVRIDQ